ncbi:hypothetical protein CEXT_661711 [Caerostris extrusa]|uniref:Uncharacterized protein n=1 Tax=Caerostris extrusa TaxID=172846 RepID=A0AAV4S9E8_CAEEX|nr:hypothetical protein CEXT_661711 [Caerostris extrusa]
MYCTPPHSRDQRKPPPLKREVAKERCPNPFDPTYKMPINHRSDHVSMRPLAEIAEKQRNFSNFSLFLTSWVLLSEKKEKTMAQYSNTHYRLFHVKLRS